MVVSQILGGASVTRAGVGCRCIALRFPKFFEGFSNLNAYAIFAYRIEFTVTRLCRSNGLPLIRQLRRGCIRLVPFTSRSCSLRMSPFEKVRVYPSSFTQSNELPITFQSSELVLGYHLNPLRYHLRYVSSQINIGANRASSGNASQRMEWKVPLQLGATQIARGQRYTDTYLRQHMVRSTNFNRALKLIRQSVCHFQRPSFA